MRRLLSVLLLTLFVFSGCTSTRSVAEENEILVTFSHNKMTDYTLLVYESDNGDTRQVLRHEGVYELILIETSDGEYLLKKRGEEAQKLDPEAVPDVKNRISNLVYGTISDAKAHHDFRL